MTQDLHQEQPHSVWLLPEPATQARLQTLIDRIAATYALECFAPHLTLLGDLHHAPDLTVRACRQHMETSGPIDGRVLSVSRTSKHFMSLFLDVTLYPDLAQVRDRIFETVTARLPTAFRPHVSVAYGLDVMAEPEAGAHAILDDFVGRQIRFDRVCVVKSAKSVPVHEWRVLSELDLNNSC